MIFFRFFAFIVDKNEGKKTLGMLGERGMTSVRSLTAWTRMLEDSHTWKTLTLKLLLSVMHYLYFLHWRNWTLSDCWHLDPCYSNNSCKCRTNIQLCSQKSAAVKPNIFRFHLPASGEIPLSVRFTDSHRLLTESQFSIWTADATAELAWTFNPLQSKVKFGIWVFPHICVSFVPKKAAERKKKTFSGQDNMFLLVKIFFNF